MDPPVPPPTAPAVHVLLPLAAPQVAQQLPLNWSHFKSEFAVKPEEYVEVHLLCTNNWMNIHNIPEGVNVNRFSLTLVGEVRLWYDSLQPIANIWQALQDQFRQQYPKIGNTREQVFCAWRSFHYDENVETIDAYVHTIRQVAALLGYGEPQILEVFQNTVFNKLYWILYPIDS